ncbi:hypothetical protein CLOM_g4039 [Closterium sp. NIES-68]|nr:hypothetical protein CLOM_g18772 [Closterium sp. NIES-68]GJP44674.1 hypothetical protein CLOM_g4039 [Closterium sp. NIES-68]GJP62406.1 hypothetical protein CLOP_g19474 [Closterium sp. NIES-67]
MMASATSALHLSPIATTTAHLRPSPSSSTSPASAAALCSAFRPVLPVRFRHSSHRPVAAVTVSKAPYRSRTVRCQAASGGDAAAPSPSAAPAPSSLEPAAAAEAKGHAFIHDFCFGITFGMAAAVAGIVWFLVTKSADALRLTALFGATIALGGVGSLRAWRKGQSSTPYILGQAMLCAVLAYQAFLRLQVTGAVFPLGLGMAVSAAMVLFYIYVILAGGNPPPKKKAVTAA